MTRVVEREVALGLVDTWQLTEAEELEARLADPADDHAAARRFFELRLAIMACMRASIEQAPDPEESVDTLMLTAATFSGVLLRLAHGGLPPRPESFVDATSIFMRTFAEAAGISHTRSDAPTDRTSEGHPTRH